MDPAVRRVDGVGLNLSERVKMGARNRFPGADVEGHDVGLLCEPSQNRKTSEKGAMNIGCHPMLPDGRKKGHKAFEGG